MGTREWSGVIVSGRFAWWRCGLGRELRLRPGDGASADGRRLRQQTVRKRLAVAGVKVRSHNRALSDEELSRARSAIDGGASARAVARDLGVAHTTLLRALKRAWSAR